MDTPYYLQAGETFFAELDPRRCILRVTHRDVVYAFSSERPPFLEAEVDGAVQTIPFDMACAPGTPIFTAAEQSCLCASRRSTACGGTRARWNANWKSPGTRRAPCAASASPSRWISTARTGRHTPSCP